MSRMFYAMDTSFYTTIGAYEFDARCEILKELGYDATYLTAWSEAAWNDVPKLKSVRSRFGLDVASVYAMYDLSKGPEEGDNARVVNLIRTVDGCQNVQLAVVESKGTFQKSNAAGDGVAQKALEHLLRLAEPRGVQLRLYPHINLWMERIDDTVRICRKMGHPNLGVVFCGYHWFAVDGEELVARLENAKPFLRDVNLCGSRRIRVTEKTHYTVETLDDGELDNFAILGALRSIGYDGMIGVQGYSVGGDVYAKLRRSLAAYREMTRRLDLHTDWARMR
jgi:sugar phosphate isomerase/epimerase